MAKSIISFRLFIISLLLTLGSFIITSLWESLELGENKILLAVALIVAFGLSIAGLIIGLSEKRKHTGGKIWIGIVGHVLIILLFGLTVVSSIIGYQ